jgi:hypothetical protein
LSTSAIHKGKRLWPYLAAAVLCVLVANIYALFGHGVRSAAMDTMFAYPLVLGGAVKILSSLVRGDYGHGAKRVGVNLYNSGLAALTCGALLRGIVHIAGTDSSYIPWFFVAGWGMALGGVTAMLYRKR